MAGPIIIVPAHARLGEGFTKKEVLKSMEHPGRQTNSRKGYQTQSAWLDDLGALRKCILLCDFCRHKWNPRTHGYRPMFVPDYSGATDGYRANGWCDSCKEHTANMGGGRAFVHEEEYAKLCVDPKAARRRAREAWDHERAYGTITK
jgi:hypothetical protein